MMAYAKTSLRAEKRALREKCARWDSATARSRPSSRGTGGQVRSSDIDAADLGLPRSVPGDLEGGDPGYNAAVARRIVDGETGPVRDAVLVNAAAAIASYRSLDGDLLQALASGLGEAEKAIDSGAAKVTLARWADVAASARSS